VKRLTKKRYLAISRRLHREAAALGYTMTVYRRPINWEAIRNGSHVVGHYSGYCDFKEKKLVITVYGKAGYARQLYIMHHELRHAQHVVGRLFKDYYRLSLYRLVDWIQGKVKRKPRVRPPCTKTAYLAELDCDRFASKEMRKLGLRVKSPPYRFNTTFASYIVRELKSTKK
jgi:hypothetical protein